MTHCVDSHAGNEKADVLVIGDSHASDLFHAIRADQSTTSVAMIGGQGCPPLRGTRYWTKAEPFRRDLCPRLIDAAYQYSEGPAKTVVLASRFSYYLSARLANDFFDSIHEPNRSRQSFIKDALTSDLTYLLDGGHLVLFVLQVPELDFNPRSCFTIRPIDRFPKRSEPDCSVNRTQVEADQAEFRSLLQAVVSDLHTDRLVVLDPMTALCDDARCHAMHDGVMLYRDRDHLSRAGSAYVWSRLKPPPMVETSVFNPSRVRTGE